MGETPLLCGLAAQDGAGSDSPAAWSESHGLAAYAVLESAQPEALWNVTESQGLYLVNFSVFSCDSAEERECDGLIQATSKHKISTIL